MTPEPLPLETAPEFTPGAMQTVKERRLPSGHLITFEFAPAGWLKRTGAPRYDDWRAYYLTASPECEVCGGSGRAPSEKRQDATIRCKPCKGTGRTQRTRVESVTTICGRILPKDGLPPWAEMAGIHGTVEAVRRGLITAHSTDEEAVAIVRANKLGADAERNRAANRGLNVHALLEMFMLTGAPPNPADHPQPHRPFIRGLVKWLLWADPEPEAVELIVADPERGYAGRLDLLARIDGRVTLVDLKTQENGAIYESAHIQAGLYRDAELRWGEHRPTHAVVVVVDGHGSFREMDLLADAELSNRALAFYAQIKPVTAGCNQQNSIIRQALKDAA
ncbi:MAG: hypothetical protein ACRDLV_10475 [Solirubrobacteraceae bacterium]